MNVRYYLITKGAKRNRGITVVFGEWPVRSMRCRGWLNAPLIFTRSTTAEEEAEVSRSTRFMSYRYASVALLLVDEEEILPADAFQALKAALEKATKQTTKQTDQ